MISFLELTHSPANLLRTSITCNEWKSVVSALLLSKKRRSIFSLITNKQNNKIIIITYTVQYSFIYLLPNQQLFLSCGGNCLFGALLVCLFDMTRNYWRVDSLILIFTGSIKNQALRENQLPNFVVVKHFLCKSTSKYCVRFLIQTDETHAHHVHSGCTTVILSFSNQVEICRDFSHLSFWPYLWSSWSDWTEISCGSRFWPRGATHQVTVFKKGW